MYNIGEIVIPETGVVAIERVGLDGFLPAFLGHIVHVFLWQFIVRHRIAPLHQRLALSRLNIALRVIGISLREVRMLGDGFFKAGCSGSTAVVSLCLEIHRIHLSPLVSRNSVVGPGVGIGYEFVLHSDIVAHPKCLARHKVGKEEIGLARLQHVALV